MCSVKSYYTIHVNSFLYRITWHRKTDPVKRIYFSPRTIRYRRLMGVKFEHLGHPVSCYGRSFKLNNTIGNGSDISVQSLILLVNTCHLSAIKFYFDGHSHSDKTITFVSKICSIIKYKQFTAIICSRKH